MFSLLSKYLILHLRVYILLHWIYLHIIYFLNIFPALLLMYAFRAVEMYKYCMYLLKLISRMIIKSSKTVHLYRCKTRCIAKLKITPQCLLKFSARLERCSCDVIALFAYLLARGTGLGILYRSRMPAGSGRSFIFPSMQPGVIEPRELRACMQSDIKIRA